MEYVARWANLTILSGGNYDPSIGLDRVGLDSPWPTAGARADKIWPHMTLSACVWGRECVCLCESVWAYPASHLSAPACVSLLLSSQLKCDRRFMLEINPTLNGIQFEHSI